MPGQDQNLATVQPAVDGSLLRLHLIAPGGHELFPLTLTTLALSLVGHLIYGAIMGFGYWKSRELEVLWPVRVGTSPESRTSRLSSGASTPPRRHATPTPNPA